MPLDRSVGNYFDATNAHLVRVARWTGPASYATGGEDVSAAVFGLGKIVNIQAIGVAVNAAGTTVRLVTWNPTLAKLQWWTAISTEVGAGVDLSTYTVSFVVFGN